MEIAGYAAAMLIGLSLGTIGGGGSILTMPVLVYFFAIEPALASSYSLFIVGITSAFGAESHYRKNNIDFRIAFIFGLPSLLAVCVMRRWIMPFIPQQLIALYHFDLTKNTLLMLIFAFLMLASAFFMVRNAQGKLTSPSRNELRYLKLILQSTMIGIITGFIGVGGGFLIIPSLVLFAGLPMKRAVGTSLLIMTTSCLLGVLGDLTENVAINYPFLIEFSTFSVAGIVAGSYLNQYISNAKLKPAFGWFLLFMGAFVLMKTIIK